MKKLLILIVGLLSSIAGISSALADNFTDISDTHPHSVAISYLDQEGIMRGQGNSLRFDPGGLINRAEWVTVLVRVKDTHPSSSQYHSCFPDVDSQWFAAAVCFSKEQGWVKGYQAGDETGKFIPDNPLNLSEILVLISRMFDWPLGQGYHWYSAAQDFAIQSNIISPGMNPWEGLTRAEAAEILFRAMAIEEFDVSSFDPILGELLLDESEDPTDHEQPVELYDPNSVRVDLKAFAEGLPEATVAQGALYVPALRFQLESFESVTITELKIDSVFLGLTQDLDRGRLVVNGEVIKDSGFLISEKAVIWRDLEIGIEPNETLLVEMNLDFSNNAVGERVYQFQIKPSNITFRENVSVRGDKITGQYFKTLAVPANKIIIRNSNAVVRVPEMESQREIVGKFEITTGEHDVVLRRLRFDEAEDFNSNDFRNIRVAIGSRELASLSDISGHVLDFKIDDYLLKAGQTKTFTIRADIISPRKIDHLRIYLENSFDIHAYDLEYGFGVQVDNQFDYHLANCVGSDTPTCPAEGFRKRCEQWEIDEGVFDCGEGG